MDVQIKEVLAAQGLDDEETSIYLFVLKNGCSTQQSIAEATGMLRQTIYDRVRKLESQGILTKTNEVGRPLFSATPPAVFLEQLKEKEQQLKNILPSLDALAKLSENQTTSTTFSGIASLKKLMLLTLTTEQEILWIANKEKSDQAFSEHFWLNYGVRREEKKIPIKLLIEPTKDKGWKGNAKVVRITKMHPFVKNQNSSLIVSGEQIILYTFSKGIHYGIRITDRHLARFFTQFFNLLWKDAQDN